MHNAAAVDWDLSRVEEILERYGQRREALIGILQDIQAFTTICLRMCFT